MSHLLRASYLRSHPRRSIALAAALVVALVAGLTIAAMAPQAQAAGSLLSQGRPATASSVENAAFPASNAVDGDLGTRWSSAFSDP
ncbi:MAG: discoidin domain-containing protein, partial [Micromonosporaceae bacterium]|nr:discoidin domain-containing protein [Micromonosporaceae bacterium]